MDISETLRYIEEGTRVEIRAAMLEMGGIEQNWQKAPEAKRQGEGHRLSGKPRSRPDAVSLPNK